MVLGDEIIETPPLIRGRYFENDLIKDHLLDCFKRGARWTIAPRPLMINESFDRSYSGENPTDAGISKFEIMFDGAQCVKFGRDIAMYAVNEKTIASERYGSRATLGGASGCIRWRLLTTTSMIICYR